jgi:hypothetical protein
MEEISDPCWNPKVSQVAWSAVADANVDLVDLQIQSQGRSQQDSQIQKMPSFEF